MVRILILIILVWALYQIVKRILASASSSPDDNPEQKLEQKLEQKIVQCAYCGCHVPENESQIKNNKIICNNPECQTQTDQEDQHGN
jgi:hypothetical protein